MKFKHVLIAVLVLFLCLDVLLILDESFDFFRGEVVTVVENFKENSKDKIDRDTAAAKEKLEQTVSKVSQKFIPAEETAAPVEPVDLEVFRLCYPDVSFDAFIEEGTNEWIILITAPVIPGKPDKKRIKLYWAGGRLLPEEELENAEKYWPLIYKYEKIKDPSLLTAEEIEKVRAFASRESRKSAGGTPMFFYDFLYAAKSQVIIEDHIKRTTFLGKKTKIHERVFDKLKNVEKKIYEQAATDESVKAFIDGLKSADAYNWRVIAGTGGRKSFHSYGISIDLLPKKLGGKAIFWDWTRDKDPQNWMLTPLNRRWNPPQSVIDAFEEEGFIWGGNWIIFDNMHFEYHPELLKN